MQIYTGGNATKQSTLVQIPANMLVGCFNVAVSDSSSTLDYEKTVSDILNKSTATLTLVDNYKSVQEVMATKIPLSFFNDLSSMGEGAVVHSVNGTLTAPAFKIMFKIPIAYVGSLDLNSQKYLRLDLEYSSNGIALTSVEIYARQTRALTNELIQYKRLNVPDGVLTYEFVPEGPAYVVAGQSGITSIANIDFVEVAYNTGVTSRVDFFELVAKYYEENEVSSRLISSVQGFSEKLFESTILALESVGVKSIRIVRNNTEDDTTIVCLTKYVSSATDNRISNGDVTKLVTGEYVPNRPAVRAEMELISVLEPMKSYAVGQTIKTAVENVPVSSGSDSDPIRAAYAAMR